MVQAQAKGEAQALVAKLGFIQVEGAQVGQGLPEGCQQVAPGVAVGDLGGGELERQRQIAQLPGQGRCLIAPVSGGQSPQPALEQRQRLRLGHDIQVVQVGAQLAGEGGVARGDHHLAAGSAD